MPSYTLHLVIVLEGGDLGHVSRNRPWGSYAHRKSAQHVIPVGSQLQCGSMNERRSGFSHA